MTIINIIVLEYLEAKEFYTNAIKICPDDFVKEKAIFHANRAACLVKIVSILLILLYSQYLPTVSTFPAHFFSHDTNLI